MSNKVMVRINKCGLFPEGAEVELDSWQIDHHGERAYFKEGATLGSVVIPEDTVLVFNPPVIKGAIEATATEVVQGTWSLSYGIHRGTVNSRDRDHLPGFESLEALKKSYQRKKQNHLASGAKCWFADAIPPEGTDKNKVPVDTPVPYW